MKILTDLQYTILHNIYIIINFVNNVKYCKYINQIFIIII